MEKGVQSDSTTLCTGNENSKSVRRGVQQKPNAEGLILEVAKILR